MKITEQSYKRLQGAVTTHYPQLRTKILAGGINVYSDKGAITIYFKKQIYNHNKNTRWLNFDGLDDLFERIDNIIGPAKEKAVEVPVIGQAALIKAMQHIETKIAFGITNGLSNSNIFMLKNLLQELKQYL